MIARFTLVQIEGSLDGKPRVTAWSASAYEQPGLSTAHRLLGVTMTTSEDDQPVAVMKHGYLREVSAQNGETWAVGEVLWAKSGGTITHTRPVAPFPLVAIGSVFAMRTGPLFDVDVDVRVLPSLGELSGVSVETPEDLDVFIYKASTHLWEPRVLDYGNRSTFMHPFLLMGGS